MSDVDLTRNKDIEEKKNGNMKTLLERRDQIILKWFGNKKRNDKALLTKMMQIRRDGAKKKKKKKNK